MILRDLATAHPSLRCGTRAVTGSDSIAWQDHRTHDPGTVVPAGQHLTEAAERALLCQTAGSHERGSDDRQGRATASGLP